MSINCHATVQKSNKLCFIKMHAKLDKHSLFKSCVEMRIGISKNGEKFVICKFDKRLNCK